MRQRPSPEDFNAYNKVIEYAQDWVTHYNRRLISLVKSVHEINGIYNILDIKVSPDLTTIHGDCLIISVTITEQSPGHVGGSIPDGPPNSLMYLIVPYDSLTPILFEKWCTDYFDKELTRFNEMQAALSQGTVDIEVQPASAYVRIRENFHPPDEGC